MNIEKLNEYLKENKKVNKINLTSLEKIADKDVINKYIEEVEGLQPGFNYKNKVIREYVDQELSSELDVKITDFIVKIRDLYFKKKQKEPLKAKKRLVVGMREVEKYLKLEYVKCVIIIPNIEKIADYEEKSKSEDEEDLDEKEENQNADEIKKKPVVYSLSNKSSSLDERLNTIIWHCRTAKVPFYFGLNKFKLGKACRKKNSSVSVAAIVNIEGLDREFNSLMEECHQYRLKFYTSRDKNDFLKNPFIDVNLFDEYKEKSK